MERSDMTTHRGVFISSRHTHAAALQILLQHIKPLPARECLPTGLVGSRRCHLDALCCVYGASVIVR